MSSKSEPPRWQQTRRTTALHSQKSKRERSSFWTDTLCIHLFTNTPWSRLLTSAKRSTNSPTRHHANTILTGVLVHVALVHLLLTVLPSVSSPPAATGFPVCSCFFSSWYVADMWEHGIGFNLVLAKTTVRPNSHCSDLVLIQPSIDPTFYWPKPPIDPPPIGPNSDWPNTALVPLSTGPTNCQSALPRLTLTLT